METEVTTNNQDAGQIAQQESQTDSNVDYKALYLEEVQNSNMSKLGSDGKPIYNDKGKVMKGPNYFKPDLGKFVA